MNATIVAKQSLEIEKWYTKEQPSVITLFAEEIMPQLKQYSIR
jgi:hypothetical protein